MLQSIRFVHIAIVGLLVMPVGAAEWPQFRGPGGASSSAEKNLPVAWSATDGLRWKAELPGRGLSNPVTAHGKLFLTASSGYENRNLHVLAFDAVTGKQLWERRFAATGETACHPKTCMAANTPVTDGENVYALFGTGDIAALDHNGNLLWYRSLVGDYPMITNQVGMAASPVVYKDVLLVPMENVGDSFAAALDKRTGRNLWKVKRTKDINWVTPLIVEKGGRVEVLFQTSKELTSYDINTGKVNWSFSPGGTEEMSPVSSPVQGQGLLFVAGNKEFMALKPSLDRAAPEIVWKSKKLSLGYTSALYHEGRVYGIGRAGVFCLDARDGSEKWFQRVEGQFSASPVIADGKLYLANEGGTTTVLKLGDKPEVLSVNEVKETILATPAISGGAVFLRSDKYLYCIGEKK